jgi:hypothetical protein
MFDFFFFGGNVPTTALSGILRNNQDKRSSYYDVVLPHEG